MENRLATRADLDEIMEVIAQAQAFMRAQGLDQWQDGYPQREIFETDIERGDCYLFLSGGETAAVVTASLVPEAAYEDIHDGQWLTEGKRYSVIHRLAIKDKYRGSGLGREIISFSETLADVAGCKSVRVDTHKDNKPMRRLLEKQGYTNCGTVYLEGRNKPRLYRVAYEKLL